MEKPEWLKELDINTAVSANSMSDLQRKEKAVELIIEYGMIDGSHHKMWCLDQVLQFLLGNEYMKTIVESCDGDDGPFTSSIARKMLNL